MRRILPRNKNGDGRTCKNRLQIYLDDEQNEFLNKLSDELKMSKTDIFRWLLREEFEKRHVNSYVNDVILCKKK